MALSDSLTVLSILVAVIALLSEENRKLFLLKFDWRHWVGIGGVVFLIHIVLGFNWVLGHIPVFSVFAINGWPKPGTWAYLFTMGLLLYLFYKIAYSPFSPKKIEEVKALYRSLLLKNDGDKLVNAIQKYHLANVGDYLDQLKAIEESYRPAGMERLTPENTILRNHQIKEKRDSEIANLKSKPRTAYSAMVYQDIIQNHRFIEIATNTYPLVYVDIIKRLNTKSTADWRMVQTFYKSLLKNNHEQLGEELRSLHSRDLGHQYHVTDDQPLLFAIVDDLNVTIHNAAWKAFGDAAIEELKTELNRGSLLMMEPPLGQNEDIEIWNSATKKAIVYFDCIVRKAIVTQVKSNMHLYYCTDMLRELTSPTLRYIHPGNNRARILAKEIRDMFVNWCEISAVYRDSPLTDDILGKLIEAQIILSNNDRDHAEEHISYVFRLLAEITDESDPESLHPVIKKYIDILGKRIQEIIAEQSVNNKPILNVISSVWYERDRSLFSAPRYQPFLTCYDDEIIRNLPDSQ